MTEYKIGDKVRLIAENGVGMVPHGQVGTVAGVRDHAFYVYSLLVDFPQANRVDLRLEEVEPVRDAEATGSAVKSPSYYVLPNGHEVIEFSQWLNGNGAQAVQYIARATRIDGVIKDDPIQDIEKAILFLKAEKNRLESLS